MSKKFIEFLNEADKNEVLYVGTKKKMEHVGLLSNLLI